MNVSNNRFFKPLSLCKRSRFLEIQKEGYRFKGRNMIIFIKKNSHNIIRIGYTVSKKVGNAVIRNKVKRRLREIIRMYPDYILNSYDYVAVAFYSINKLNFQQIKSELIWLLKKAQSFVFHNKF